MLGDLRATLTELNTFSVFFRLLLAVIFSGIIGLERGFNKRPAGMRTYILVCLGSTLVMITNQYIAEIYTLTDPTRLGAQVISGIGFLGVGTIIVTHERQVKGLTTAAGLWANACMGLAIGVGFYEGAFFATLFIFLVITVMHSLNSKVTSRARNVDVYIELIRGERLSSLFEYLHQHSLKVTNVEVVKSKYQDKKAVATLISLRLAKRQAHYEIIDVLNHADCVDYVEEI